MEKTIQQFHCKIVKKEISILRHVIVKSQLNRDNLTRCYIKVTIADGVHPCNIIFLDCFSIISIVTKNLKKGKKIFLDEIILTFQCLSMVIKFHLFARLVHIIFL